MYNLQNKNTSVKHVKEMIITEYSSIKLHQCRFSGWEPFKNRTSQQH